MKSTITVLLLFLLVGCQNTVPFSGTYSVAYTLPDGRKALHQRTYSPGMITDDLWAESQPGSGVYAAVSQTAVAGVLQTLGTAVVQGSAAMATAAISPAAAAGSVVNVIATGGNGGNAAAVSN